MTQPNAHLFRFCPKCGQNRLRPADRRSFSCDHCGFHFYLNCAAAAIGLVFDADRRLCITRRKHDPARDMYDFPGGFAEPGETIETCIKREIQEELNLSVRKVHYLFSHPNTYQYEDVSYDITDFIFLCRTDSLQSIRARDDVKEVLFKQIPSINREHFAFESAKAVIDWLRTAKGHNTITALHNRP